MDFLKKIPIYCINLLEREDRYQDSVSEFERVGLMDHVIFKRVNKSKYGGTYGCFESHMNIYKESLKKNYPYILIFEDDFIFRDDNLDKCISRVKRVMENYPNWLKISVQNNGTIEAHRQECGIYWGNFVHTRCYFISKRAMKRCVNKGITQNHIDLQQLFDFQDEEVFIVRPAIMYDKVSASDNYGNENDPKIIRKLVKLQEKTHLPALIEDRCNMYLKIFTKAELYFRKKVYDRHNKPFIFTNNSNNINTL